MRVGVPNKYTMIYMKIAKKLISADLGELLDEHIDWEDDGPL